MKEYKDGFRFVSLASVTEPRFVADALTSVQGLNILLAPSISELLSYLADKNMLLVFDNCEHVIDAVAALAEEIIKAADGVHILTTSREPIRADGEHVHRLDALGVPPTGIHLDRKNALAYPAARLFVERAATASDNFEFRDEHTDVVADVCLWLDGVPLAIELAAAQVASFGLSVLSSILRDRFVLLMKGSRTALPRHQTLNATLEWSYGLLSSADKAAFRCLAIFRGAFDLEAAEAVALVDRVSPCLATLVESCSLRWIPKGHTRNIGY